MSDSNPDPNSRPDPDPGEEQEIPSHPEAEASSGADAEFDPTLPFTPKEELGGLDPKDLIEGGLHSRTAPTAWEPPSPEELHRLLPQYEIDTLLGRGGMGAVYRGRQESLDRLVAIKLLPAELAGDEEFVARFRREAKTLAKLHHPGIVLVHDFGQTDEGHLYFVMEFVDGTDLHKIIHGPGLDCAQALEIVGQICDALQFAHSKGVVHRDIKPANVILSVEGEAKLADFGLARPVEDGSGVFTQSNVVMGTPDYIAPEALAGEADHRADLYSLGVMLYEMLTGKPPRGAWATPSERVQVDVRLDEVVVRALQEDPDLRYQQASEIRTDVEAIRTTPLQGVAKPKKQKKSKPSPSRALSKKRGEDKKSARSKLPWLVGVGLAVVLGIAAFLFPRGPQPSREVLSAREQGGRLRVFGSAENGQPDLTGASSHSDFVEVAIGKYGWVGRRAGGETFGEAGSGDSHKRTPVGPFMTSGLQIGNRGNPTFLTVEGEFRNVWHQSSQIEANVGESGASFVLNPYDYVVTLTGDGKIVSTRPWHSADKSRQPPPSDFFLGATAWASCKDYYLSAQPDGQVRSFRVNGTETTFPNTIRDIVEMDSGERVVILRSSNGEVFVTDPEGKPTLGEVPPDLGPAIAVRAGNGMVAAQMEDGTWVAWGDSPELIEQVSKIGHAVELDFYSEGPGGAAYMMWIEPLEEDAADPSLTSKEVQPASEVLAARERGGRLRVSGKINKGDAVTLGKAADHDDFVQVVVSQFGWAARRANGETWCGAWGHEENPTVIPFGPYQTRYLSRSDFINMLMEEPGVARNVWDRDSQVNQVPRDTERIIAVLDHIFALGPGGQQTHLRFDGGDHDIPDFFQDAGVMTGTWDHVICGRPGEAIRSWAPTKGESFTFPQNTKDVVEADGADQFVALRYADGRVELVAPDGLPLTDPLDRRVKYAPSQDERFVAVRAGRGMASAQRPDGLWKAWGNSEKLSLEVASLAHVVDLDFYHDGMDGELLMWIEPVDEAPSDTEHRRPTQPPNRE